MSDVAAAAAQSSLKAHGWPRFLRAPDPDLMDKLYVPALAEAYRYDRCCSYFRSSVLAAAARGFGKFIERLIALEDKAPQPAIRLVVNEELNADDVRTILETGDVTALDQHLCKRLTNPKDVLEKERLKMLAWLVAKGFLDIRVGIMRQAGGIVHAKFGIVFDSHKDTLVFAGSGNESASGLTANYERLEISGSWNDPERSRLYVDEFEGLWRDEDPVVHTMPLPEAVRLKLIKFAPDEPPIAEPSNALARQKAAMVWKFLVEAPYLPDGASACDATALVEMWPHQRSVVEETSAAWPDGRLLCDEVGMGKTIEAILVLRRLLAGRGVQRALLLLPRGILKQWQSELREKGGLNVPRLEGQSTLVWPDDRSENVGSMAEALQQDLLLMSRETARTEQNMAVLLAAQPWDLVLLDEAHAARRKEAEEGEFNQGTLLLNLLRALQLRRRAKSILLLSATPMQTNPWEPWDLLGVLGEGGPWLVEFADVRGYYNALAAVRNGTCTLPMANKAAQLIVSDSEFPPLPSSDKTSSDPVAVAQKIAFAPPTARQQISSWMRGGSPLARRMHRNTRKTLLGYFERGLLPMPPPKRTVHDERFDFQDDAERNVYEAVTHYIDARFEALEHEQAGKGFVMTVYRRRASSSPLALRRSLVRRRDGLARVAKQMAFDLELSAADAPEALLDDDLPETDAPGRLSQALPTNPAVAIVEMKEVDRLLDSLRALGNTDTKRDKFFDQLRAITDDGRPALVFTEYADTMEYIRDYLAQYYGDAVGCYSGEGGRRRQGTEWIAVDRETITASLRAGELKVLVCTDAASEGLNLQAAGALINYDLPWNPSRIEQRIGRIDRIGQKYTVIKVVNMFLRDSVDDQVYRALRIRCGLFEHFVGAMQPVLALARRMLVSQVPADPSALNQAAGKIKSDVLASETYVDSSAAGDGPSVPAASRSDFAYAMELLDGSFGPEAKTKSSGVYSLHIPGGGRRLFSYIPEAVAADKKIVPLTPFDPSVRSLANALSKPGELLPLVVFPHQEGGNRTTSAVWIGPNGPSAVSTFAELRALIDNWDGSAPEPQQVRAAMNLARSTAQQRVSERGYLSESRCKKALARQLSSAKLRLQRELGRYLTCWALSTNDLAGALQQVLRLERGSSDRIRKCLERLGELPAWPQHVCREFDLWLRSLPEAKRQARLLGSELDAALRDPRWAAEA